MIENFKNIPEELKKLQQWVVWDVKKDNPKMPFDPTTMRAAKAGVPSTWGSYDEAVKRVVSGEAGGIGFEFAENGGYVGVDLDTVRDPVTGCTADYAVDIIGQLGSYTEVSPSGYGYHIICRADIVLENNKGALPENGIIRPDIDEATGKQKKDKDGTLKFKRSEIEMYNKGRYFTMTGLLYCEKGAV